MPPKCKFTREELVQAALDIARTGGFDAITARAIGAKLHASAKPIFSVFQSMQELQQEVVAAAKRLYGEYVARGLQQTDMPAFKGVGLQYILFAKEEPKLFRLLFMSETHAEIGENYLPLADDNYPKILASVRDTYVLTDAEANRLYLHMGIYSHGIAVLIAENGALFPAQEVGNLLTEVFTGLLKEIKGGRTHA